MSDAVTTLIYRKASIISLDGKSFDISSSIIEFDYYEDILQHSITGTFKIISSYSYVNQLPIRGGERLEINLLSG